MKGLITDFLTFVGLGLIVFLISQVLHEFKAEWFIEDLLAFSLLINLKLCDTREKGSKNI